MIETISKINSVVNDFVWGVPAMICIVTVGLLLLVKTKAVQFRDFGRAMKAALGTKLSKKDLKAGAVTPFQAACTALAATVGTGNIAGVAGAIALGGPGAVFWMWISALLGMGTKFAEVVLAIKYREKNDKGEWVGGPMYFIKNGLSKKWHFLAYIYAGLGCITVFGIGNTTQINTIVSSIQAATSNYFTLSEDNLRTMAMVIGVIFAIILLIILFGGLKTIASITEKLVPFMACLYILLALGVIALRIKVVPTVLKEIVVSAFNAKAFTGGMVGSMYKAITNGFARGIFSNEAGLGTGSIAHSSSASEEPVHQGFFGIFEVFVDTMVICTLSAITILSSGVTVPYGTKVGATLTMAGFTTVYGPWVSIVTMIAFVCFAFSTTIGWGLYGIRFVEFLFGPKASKVYIVIFSLAAIVGATMDLGLIWGISDTCNGLLAIPNLVALFLLSGVVGKEVEAYKRKYNILSFFERKKLNK